MSRWQNLVTSVRGMMERPLKAVSLAKSCFAWVYTAIVLRSSEGRRLSLVEFI